MPFFFFSVLLSIKLKGGVHHRQSAEEVAEMEPSLFHTAKQTQLYTHSQDK
jgi:hypothetical protein